MSHFVPVRHLCLLSQPDAVISGGGSGGGGGGGGGVGESVLGAHVNLPLEGSSSGAQCLIVSCTNTRRTPGRPQKGAHRYIRLSRSLAKKNFFF